MVITEIDPDGHAAESGLQTGDIILDVSRRGVNTPAEVRKFVDEARAQSKKSVLLRVMRGDMVGSTPCRWVRRWTCAVSRCTINSQDT